MSDPKVVTISASYGAGGSVLAPRLAAALGLPFSDRLLTATLAGEMSPEQAGEAMQESRRARLLDRLAVITGGMTLAPVTSEDIRRPFRESVEASVHDVAANGGVLLGRAGAIVLADAPMAFHIRLDGPVGRRVRRGMVIEGVDEATARRHLSDSDRARAAYLHRLYGRRPDDPSLYHLVLDTTVLHLDDTVALLQRAAEAFFSARRC